MLRRFGDFCLNINFILEIVGCVWFKGDKKEDDGRKLETHVQWNDVHTLMLTLIISTSGIYF